MFCLQLMRFGSAVRSSRLKKDFAYDTFNIRLGTSIWWRLEGLNTDDRLHRNIGFDSCARSGNLFSVENHMTLSCYGAGWSLIRYTSEGNL